MQVADQGNHDLAQPRVRCALHDTQHRTSHVRFVANDHFSGIRYASVVTAPCEDCAPGGIRTPGPCLRRAVLYPLSYGRETWLQPAGEGLRGRGRGTA